MIVAFVGLCLLVAGALIVWLVIVAGEQRKPGWKPPAVKKGRKLDPQLQRRLELLAGSKKTARRLVIATARSNPKRSTRWCQEKTIADLERDRRV
ncbi:MAG: hypothetical protein RIG63_30360 [Coleofasciculus chthonoplastes F3-SA18-01]|uniref:hypothetical protein n=1 Tax=Coleofasciculus chthonoplastes TaxID=64178 RepID=UPI0032F5DBEA